MIENSHRHTFEFASINAIAQALNQSIELETALNVTMAEVARLFDLETGWVW